MLYVLGLSPVAVWVGVVVSFMAFSILFYRRYRGGKRRTIRMVRTPIEPLAADHDLNFHEPPDL